MPRPPHPSWQELPARLAPESGAPTTSTRPWWRRRVTVVPTVIVLVIAGLVSFDVVHRSHAPFDIRGHYVIVGADNFTGSASGSAASSHDECAGTGAFYGMGTDQPIDISEPGGRTLASGPILAALAGTDDATGEDTCDLVFDIADVPTGHDRYAVSFYGRHAHVFSQDELRKGVAIWSDDEGPSA